MVNHTSFYFGVFSYFALLNVLKPFNVGFSLLIGDVMHEK